MTEQTQDLTKLISEEEFTRIYAEKVGNKQFKCDEKAHLFGGNYEYSTYPIERALALRRVYSTFYNPRARKVALVCGKTEGDLGFHPLGKCFDFQPLGDLLEIDGAKVIGTTGPNEDLISQDILNNTDDLIYRGAGMCDWDRTFSQAMTFLKQDREKIKDVIFCMPDRNITYNGRDCMGMCIARPDWQWSELQEAKKQKLGGELICRVY